VVGGGLAENVGLGGHSASAPHPLSAGREPTLTAPVVCLTLSLVSEQACRMGSLETHFGDGGHGSARWSRLFLATVGVARSSPMAS
jgi:hypothetical protein